MSEGCKQLRLNLQLQAALQREYFHCTFSLLKFYWKIEGFLYSKKFPVIFKNFNLITGVNAHCHQQSCPQELNLDDVVRRIDFLDNMVNKRKGEHINFVVATYMHPALAQCRCTLAVRSLGPFKVAEHSFRAHSCWCDSACAQGW